MFRDARFNCMDFPEYVASLGRGGMAAISRSSGVSRTTVEKAARGEPISVPGALTLSRATGGVVPATALAGLAGGAADPAQELGDEAGGDAA